LRISPAVVQDKRASVLVAHKILRYLKIDLFGVKRQCVFGPVDEALAAYIAS
jgi:hypothetical protein